MNFEPIFHILLCKCCANSVKENCSQLIISQLQFYFVALEGFEPSQAEPESDVLPLHHMAIGVFVLRVQSYVLFLILQAFSGFFFVGIAIFLFPAGLIRIWRRRRRCRSGNLPDKRASPGRTTDNAGPRLGCRWADIS